MHANLSKWTFLIGKEVCANLKWNMARTWIEYVTKCEMWTQSVNVGFKLLNLFHFEYCLDTLKIQSKRSILRIESLVKYDKMWVSLNVDM